MKILNLLNPIRNTIHRLATVGSTASIVVSLAAHALATTPVRSQVILGGDFVSYKSGSSTTTATLTGVGGYVSWPVSIPNFTAPTSLMVFGGTSNYRERTTGFMVDLPGWTKIQGGAGLFANGPGSLRSLNLFAPGGGSIRPIVEMTGPLHTIGVGETATTLPPLASFEGDKSGGSVLIKEPVAFIVTFSEPMPASTVSVTDFANTGATAITVNRVTTRANPAVFLVSVTPAETGILHLQVMAGVPLTANSSSACS